MRPSLRRQPATAPDGPQGRDAARSLLGGIPELSSVFLARSSRLDLQAITRSRGHSIESAVAVHCESHEGPTAQNPLQ
jgi:hypothetical protein